MRLGLRPQILLMVMVLLGLALVPLYWTATTISRLSVGHAEESAALNLSRSVARSLADGRLQQDLGHPIVGSTVTHSDGAQTSLGQSTPAGVRSIAAGEGVRVRSSSGQSIWSWARGNAGMAYVGVDIEPALPHAHSLFGLLALYIGLLGIGLLLAIHLAVTFVVVRPLDALGRAARRVAFGARELVIPKLPAQELVSLGDSLRTMTEKLLADERELRNRIEQIDLANQRLKQAQERLIRSERLASVGKLAAGLAHEVGNPIAAMIGLEELLLAGGLSAEEQTDFLRRIRSETERVHRVLRDLLDFARPARDLNQEVEPPGDVAVSISETLSLIRPQKAFKEITIETAIAPDLSLVRLSRPKLIQVLLNLLLNAADATVGTHTHTRATTGLPVRIRLCADPSAFGVTISVADNGPGVPSEVREHLFEPFVTTKEVGKGTGLGLAVCRGLVESIGGSIQLDAAYRDGARFVLELPRA
ncbi:MAG TPA: ATP-binding protein [Polyangiaceae bacterium]|nr:ATP-binding protein [Polyangiaceae bacterium]